MSTPDGRLWITYNGEVYNYPELRAELESRGVTFRSQSDTEVVLWAYRHWGTAAFERFIGLWAFALWDEDAQHLVLCRDRFGIKPLVYAVDGDRVAFASEAKAIVTVFPAERRPNLRELGHFLTGAYPNTSEATFFAGIQAVRPGHAVVVSRNAIRSERYWRFEPGQETARPDAEEAFRALLTDAVRLSMRSDVPVAACLSGGLDSTAVTRLAAGFTDRPIDCFSLKYDEPAVDESAYASAAAAGDDRLIIHWVRPDPTDLLGVMRRIVRHNDQPVPSRGRYPEWFVHEAVGRHARVVLSGTGSDELLGGYLHFLLPYLLDHRLIGRAGWRALWREFVDLRRVTPAARLQHIFLPQPARALRVAPWRWQRVHSSALHRARGGFDSRRYAHGWLRSDVPHPYRSRLNTALWHELTGPGMPESLHSQDTIAMAHGVESRPPFLDHRLVEFCLSLPYDEKIRGGWTKSLLRRALPDVLPEPIARRRPKLGFPAPLARWFASHSADIEAHLRDGEAVRAGLFDRRRVERQLRPWRAADHPSRRRDVEALWRWITVEWWYRDSIARPWVDERPESAGVLVEAVARS
jgi:asparagine synthase (glutamine-hydrolysing)